MARLAGLYGGDPAKALQRGGDDYAVAVLAATGTFMKRGKEKTWTDKDKENLDDTTKIVSRASEEIAGIYKRYWYDTATAADFLRDRGIPLDDGKTAARDADRLVRASRGIGSRGWSQSGVGDIQK